MNLIDLHDKILELREGIEELREQLTELRLCPISCQEPLVADPLLPPRPWVSVS